MYKTFGINKKNSEPCLNINEKDREYAFARLETIDLLKKSLSNIIFLSEEVHTKWCTNTNDSFVRCALDSFDCGKNINIYIQSNDIDIDIDNCIKLDLIRGCTLGCMSQLAIEIEQIKSCLQSYYVYLNTTPIIQSVYQIIITKKEINNDKNIKNITKQFQSCNIKTNGGAFWKNKIKLLGRVRNIHIVKNEHGKNIKMVKYIGRLVPISFLKSQKLI